MSRKFENHMLIIVAVASSIAFADGSKTKYQTVPASNTRDYNAPA